MSSPNPNQLYRDKPKLIELANDYLQKNDWLYPNGQPAVPQTIHPADQRQHH